MKEQSSSDVIAISELNHEREKKHTKFYPSKAHRAPSSIVFFLISLISIIFCFCFVSVNGKHALETQIDANNFYRLF
jgi:hypothetical protein